MNQTLKDQAKQVEQRLREGIVDDWDDAADTIAFLITELEAAERDAARYRWLRATTNKFTNSKGERIEVKLEPHKWDESIDAAIAQGAKT